MNDFVIEYITISEGHYVFHNGNVKKRLNEISINQINEYLNYAIQQARLCIEAKKDKLL